MSVYTLILLGFVLGWIARHCFILMSETAHGFVRKLHGIRRVELDFHEEDERPKLKE